MAHLLHIQTQQVVIVEESMVRPYTRKHGYRRLTQAELQSYKAATSIVVDLSQPPKVAINSVEIPALTAIPKINLALAKKIAASRPYDDFEELKLKVAGVDWTGFEDLFDYSYTEL